MRGLPVADEKTPVELRNEKMLEALDNIAALNSTADSRLAGWVTDIRVGLRDRELHHFEAEQENERLHAESDRLKRELLAVNNYAILRKGSGWDAEFTLIHWDEEEMIWTEVEDRISRGAAVVLRDTYNARINP